MSYWLALAVIAVWSAIALVLVAGLRRTSGRRDRFRQLLGVGAGSYVVAVVAMALAAPTYLAPALVWLATGAASMLVGWRVLRLEEPTPFVRAVAATLAVLVLVALVTLLYAFL